MNSQGYGKASARCVSFRSSIWRGRPNSTMRHHAYRFPRVIFIGLLCALAHVNLVPATAHALQLANAPLNASPLLGQQPSGQAPAIRAEPYEVNVYSTRMHYEVLIEDFNTPAKFRAEYSEHEGGPWTFANEGNIETGNGDLPISIGSLDGTRESGVGVGCLVLHHLNPSTEYFIRYEVQDEESGLKAEGIFRQKTDAVDPPEVALRCKQKVTSTFHKVEQSRVQGLFDVNFDAQVETNGGLTEYNFDYAPAEPNGSRPPEGSGAWTPFTTHATGTVGVAEGYREVADAEALGLSPETRYWARVRMDHKQEQVLFEPIDEKGNPFQVEVPSSSATSSITFTTGKTKPNIIAPRLRNITSQSARIYTIAEPNGTETHWHFEYSLSDSPSAVWQPIAGAEGVISQADAESLPEGTGEFVEATFDGLSPSTTYYVRAVANAATSATESFRTAGPPTATTLSVHAFANSEIRMLGEVVVGSGQTSSEQEIMVQGEPQGGTFTLEFDGQTTEAIPYSAPAEGGESTISVKGALEKLQAKPEIDVYGRNGGPYVVFFTGQNTGVAEPVIKGDGEDLKPTSGNIMVTVLQEGGKGTSTDYHFEYVPLSEYDKSGFQSAASTRDESVNSTVISADAELIAGETYEYRAVVKGSSPGSAPGSRRGTFVDCASLGTVRKRNMR